MSTPQSPLMPQMMPRDILAGLGVANRDLLAVFLALFDDSKLLSRIGRLYDESRCKIRRLTGNEIDESVEEVRTRLHYWKESEWPDSDLRLILWIYLREAFGLEPRLSVSRVGCEHLADDLTAALIHVMDPPGLVKSSRRWLHKKGWLETGEPALTLADIVMPVLEEYVTASVDAESDQSDPELSRRMLDSAVAAVGSLDDEDKEALLKATGATRVNDAALAKMALTGGGLTAFGSAVSSAGFSAYIVAAKASALVPMVSGPGLVSFVAVMSNPITVAGATGAAIWWFGRSAQERARATIGARVIAMLTIQGMHAGAEGLDGALGCFASAPRLSRKTGLKTRLIERYQEEWARLAPLADKGGVELDAALRRKMERRVTAPPASASDSNAEELENAAALGTMTLGEMLYSAAAIDPHVIRAADFSRLDEIDGPVDFAFLLRNLDGAAAESIQGSVNHLKGYTAEQVVASQLEAAGHTVSIPDAANQPGFDLLVDGQPFQVKFHQSLDGIREHFGRYDYPVIANAELAGDIPEEWADQVTSLDGVTNDLVQQITEDSVYFAGNLLNPHVVPFALVISGARVTMAYSRGGLSLAQAVEQVILDGTVRAGLAIAGKWAGASAGFAVFGPAGAWVLAAGLPILAQTRSGHLTRTIKAHISTEAQTCWAAAVHEALDEFQQTLLRALRERRQQLAERYRAMEDTGAGAYVRWRLRDQARFAHECGMHLELLDRERTADPEQRLADILRWLGMSTIFSGCYQSELRRVVELMKEKPGYLESARSAVGKGKDWLAAGPLGLRPGGPENEKQS